MHIPVLLREVLEYLNPCPGQKFIDATIDGGGHATAILEKIMPGGKLLGIEWDGELLKQLKFKIQGSKFKDGVVLVNDSYVNLKKVAEKYGFAEVDGIIFDLGMSRWHLEEAGRGFSFLKDEPLDMRYSSREFPISNSQFPKRTAAEIVNRSSYDELVRILKEYGEERFAKSIAAAIVEARKIEPVVSTFQLVEIIKNSTPFWYRRRRIPQGGTSGILRGRHFATKTFQALRIAVNDELENLKAGLWQAEELLRNGGRMAVISFHSLEDRIVKNFFRDSVKEKRLNILTKKPVRAGLAEIAVNPSARSAKLRIAGKIASSF
jgi:16S rRNA (cytosine1402-N4)-methyltransferase